MRSPALKTALFLLPPAVLAVAAIAWMPGWSESIAWGLAQQRQFHRELAAHLHDLGAGNGLAAWALVAVSFLYGILHAVGPGHGKAVIVAYLATHESRLARGMGLAVAASFCQGLVAVLLVGGVTLLADWLPWETQSAVTWGERASFALLAAMGALFVVRAVRRIAGTLRPASRPAASDVHVHPHDDGCACCHAPSPRQIEQASSLRTTVGVLLSIGLRPCSGAVLVLALANVLELAWAGVIAVAAMSAGTAITVATLALAVVKARHWVTVLFGGRAARHSWIGPALALMGGAAIFLLAAALLAASFAPAHPMRL